MKIKLIKKTIAMFSLVAVSVAMMGLNVAVAVDTGLERSEGAADSPIIKAKWEMLGSYVQLTGADDDQRHNHTSQQSNFDHWQTTGGRYARRHHGGTRLHHHQSLHG